MNMLLPIFFMALFAVQSAQARPVDCSKHLEWTDALYVQCSAHLAGRISDAYAGSVNGAPGVRQRGAPAGTGPRESAFARAIGQAARKGVIELAVEAYSEVLIRCQKEQSTVLTTPFMRSDSQQAHCFRF
jgi:hypothetical protein